MPQREPGSLCFRPRRYLETQDQLWGLLLLVKLRRAQLSGFLSQDKVNSESATHLSLLQSLVMENLFMAYLSALITWQVKNAGQARSDSIGLVLALDV